MGIGEKIREARKERKISQEALAEAIEVNTVSISYWENNQREVKMSTLEKIAKTLNKPLEYFIIEEKNAYSPPLLLDRENESKAIRLPVIPFDKSDNFSEYRNNLRLNDIALSHTLVSEEEIFGYNALDVFASVIRENVKTNELQINDIIIMAATDVAYSGDFVSLRYEKENLLGRLIRKEKHFILDFGNNNVFSLKEKDFRVMAKALFIKRTLKAKGAKNESL